MLGCVLGLLSCCQQEVRKAGLRKRTQQGERNDRAGRILGSERCMIILQFPPGCRPPSLLPLLRLLLPSLSTRQSAPSSEGGIRIHRLLDVCCGVSELMDLLCIQAGMQVAEKQC